MKAKGQEHSEWGFKKPNDGWHIVEMLEGVNALEKDGAELKDDKGNVLYKLPAKINDAAADDNGVDISQVVTATPFGEKKVADILAAIGEFENFEKAFPGDRSFFEPEIFGKVKIKLPGKFLKMRTETSKDGKYCNVVELAPMNYAPEDKAPTKGKSAGKEKAAASGGQAAAPGNDW